MTMLPSMRDVTLATLMIFGCSCIIVRGAPPATQPSHHATHKPKKPASKPKPAPAKPKPKPAKPKPQPQPQPQPPKPQPQPRPAPRPAPDPTPAPEPEPPPPPAIPNATTMVVPVRVGFDEAVARIDSMIAKTMKKDWHTVSAANAPTLVEVKYSVWRDPIKASFDDGTLKVAVDVRYAATVRASVKNPIGGGRIWITKGETWGTKDEPQEIRAKFHAKVGVRDDFTVHADAALDDIDHGKAPSGKLCVKAIAKVCVSKEAIAPMVHKNLEKQLVPQIKKALNDADKQVEKALNLKPHAQKIWAAMQQPQSLQQLGQASCPTELGAACSTPAWLVARPEALGLSQPRMDGKFLRVDLAFAGQVGVQLGDKPAVKPTPLPKLRPVTDPPGFAVRAKLRVPVDVLGAELSKQLADKKIGGRVTPGVVITRITLVDQVDPRHPKRLQAVVSVTGAVNGDLKLFGELAWDAKRRELSIKDFDYSVDTTNEALKKLSEADHEALRKLVSEKARWKLANRAAALGDAVTGALGKIWSGHLDVDGSLDQVDISGFTVDKGVLAADVVVAGQLGISFTP